MPITFKIPTSMTDGLGYGLQINLGDSGYNSADSTASSLHSQDKSQTMIDRLRQQQQQQIYQQQHQFSTPTRTLSTSSSFSPSPIIQIRQQVPNVIGISSSSTGSVRRLVEENPARVRYLRESVVSILDQIDTRVGFLRETVLELEDEKKKLLGVLSSLKSTDDLSLISEVDKEEILLTADRLFQRLMSVDVKVTTLRNDEQKVSLDQVNSFIEKLLSFHQDNPRKGIEMCQIYLNTCSPDSYNLVTDEKFGSALIACAAEDQKKIRKRLEALMTTFNHSDRGSR